MTLLSEIPSVNHYSLQLRLSLNEERLEAKACIRVMNETQKTFAEIPFILYRLLDVEVITDEQGNPLDFTQAVVKFVDQGKLQVNAVTVQLPKPLIPGNSVEITMKYSGSIYGYPEIWQYVQDRIGEDFSLVRTDAFSYPILAYSTMKSRHAVVYSSFTYDVQIAVPKGYIAACGGNLVDTVHQGNTIAFSYQSKVPTWRMDIAAAKYNVLKDEEDKLFVYAFPEDEAGAVDVLEAMKRATHFYSESFGQLRRYQGLTLIEIPNGLGSQAGDGYIVQTADAFKSPGGLRGVYHEIAHAWNVKAEPEVQRCRWFDEAFAQYFTALALRELEDEKAFEDLMSHYGDAFARAVQQDRQNYETPIAEYGRNELGDNSYTKGPWVLYVLHQIVGEQHFYRIIKTFLSEFSDGQADFGDFQKVAEQITGKDLDLFFNEWIFGIESSQYLLDKALIQQIARKYQ